MKPLNIAAISLLGLGLLCQARAQQAAQPAPAAPSPVAPAAEAKTDPKAAAAVAAEAEANRVKIEFAEGERVVTAHYPKSQARLKISAINRYDAEIAKIREYFILEMTGAAIVDPLVLDVDDEASNKAIIAILERFQSEAKKSTELKESMAKRKVAAADELSREETRLLDLQAAAESDAAAVAKSKARIDELKEAILLSEDLGKLKKISGPIGTAKIHLDRPAYDFVATMEPAKALYTLQAGYSFQVSEKDVKYYVDLLKQRTDFKRRLLENEARQAKLKSEVGEIFNRKNP